MSKQLELYKFISKLSSYFIKDKAFDKSMNKALKALANITKTHRTYIFTFNKQHTIMNNCYEYCKKGVNSEIGNYQNVSTEPIKWWMKNLIEKGYINISDVNVMPKSAKYEQEDLKKQQIHSILCFAIIAKGELVGFIGLDDIKNTRKWNNKTINILKLSSEIIANAFEKKLQQNDLFRTNSALEATLEATKDSIVLIKHDGEILNYNQNFIKTWSIPKSLLNQEQYKDILKHIKRQLIDDEEFEEHLKKTANNKKTESNYTAFLKNGTIIELHSKPVFVKNKFLGRVYSGTDVTEHKNYEAKLELLSRVFKSSSGAIVITNRRNQIVDVNNSFVRASGYTKKELIGMDPSVLQSNWHDKKFYKKLWKVLNKDLIWIGEIWDRKKNGELYLNRTQIHKVISNNQIYYISIAQDITKERQYEERIEKLAFYDILTNLPNRGFFNEQLESVVRESRRYEKKFALLFLDLDNFKEVNDKYGHLIGDKLLQYVAKTLKASVRISDIVSRLSGDEFTIIIKDIQDYTNIIHTCDAILEKLSQTIMIENHEVNIGCSIGVSIYPNHGQTAKELVQKADTAMYSSKHFGKNQFSFHYDGMNDDNLKYYNQKRYQTMKEER